MALNVGGKEFYTLRSTVMSNAVLVDHVAWNKANNEVSKNGAVFIDRDPSQFSFILGQLRNRMESSTVKYFDKASKPEFTKAYVELPKDPQVLRDLNVEAAFYRIPELQSALKEESEFVTLASVVNKRWNPFDAVKIMPA